MAEDYAPLWRSIWNDDEFRDLTAAAQHLYLASLSSPARGAAGLLPLTMRNWTRRASDLTVHVLDAALAELDDTGFLVVDLDTEEVLVRSYIRRAKVYTHIRLLERALREIESVQSDRLRSALGQELKRLPALKVPEPNGRNDRQVEEARAAQEHLDVLGSMLCDARPEPAGQTAAHPMGHGMGHGMAHPPGVGAGTGAGVGAGAVLGSCSSSRSSSSELNAHARGAVVSLIGRAL